MSKYAGISLHHHLIDKRSPTPQLSSRFDSRAAQARSILHEALASVPF
jgi:hypothetical protein